MSPSPVGLTVTLPPSGSSGPGPASRPLDATQEMNAWLYHGGGMELWRETYAPFGLVPLAAGFRGAEVS